MGKEKAFLKSASHADCIQSFLVVGLGSFSRSSKKLSSVGVIGGAASGDQHCLNFHSQLLFTFWGVLFGLEAIFHFTLEHMGSGPCL